MKGKDQVIPLQPLQCPETDHLAGLVKQYRIGEEKPVCLLGKQALWGKDLQKPDFEYPYKREDGRENLKAGNDILRVLRGGSWGLCQDFARCAFRLRIDPYGRDGSFGFRVVSPI